jgi:hypothetical protein
MRFFFFGTLMDPEVRRLVIGGDPPPGCPEAGVLPHFRRVRPSGRGYPMLLAHGCGRVEGILIDGLDAPAARRLVVFEGAEYRLMRLAVIDSRGRAVAAATFLSQRRAAATHRAWSLKTWQRRDKRAFLRKTARLMAGYATKAALRTALVGQLALITAQDMWLLLRRRQASRAVSSGRPIRRAR